MRKKENDQYHRIIAKFASPLCLRGARKHHCYSLSMAEDSKSDLDLPHQGRAALIQDAGAEPLNRVMG
jgi:hypothetical protein